MWVCLVVQFVVFYDFVEGMVVGCGFGLQVGYVCVVYVGEQIVYEQCLFWLQVEQCCGLQEYCWIGFVFV